MNYQHRLTSHMKQRKAFDVNYRTLIIIPYETINFLAQLIYAYLLYIKFQLDLFVKCSQNIIYY